MKKKILTILFSLIAVIACAVAFIACGGGGGNGGEYNPPSYNPPQEEVDEFSQLYKKYSGVYYRYWNIPDDTQFIVLKEDKTWYDYSGAIGKYIINEGSTDYNVTFTLYYDLSDDNIEYISIIEGGNIGFYRHFSVRCLLDGLYLSGVSFERRGVEIPQCPTNVLQYELSENKDHYIVAGIGEASGEVKVPETYRFLPVTEIVDRAFSNCTQLTSIEIPSTVKNMGVRGFEKCSNLINAKIDAPITELTEELFGGCTKLTDVYIPKTVTEINYRAFKDCEKIQNVYYGGTAKDWANIKFGISASHASSNMGSDEPYWANPISGEGRKLIINDSTVTSCELENVSDGAFFQYKYLTNVTAKRVCDYAFYYSSITSLSAGSVGKSACEGCHDLRSFSGGGIEIGMNAFFDCTAIATVSLSERLVTIGEYAFGFCEKLTEITIPVSVLWIERYAFSGTALNNVVFEYYTNTSNYGMHGPSNWIVDKDGEIYLDTTNQSIAAKYLVDDDTNNGYSSYEWTRSALAFILNSDGNSYGVACNISPGKNWSSPDGHSVDWSTPAHINIPSTYKGKPVTAITRSTVCEGFQGCHSLKSIAIPNSITKTISYPFQRCSDLTLYCEASSAPNGWSWFDYRTQYEKGIPVVWNYKNNDKDNDGYAYAVIDGIKYRLKDAVAELMCEVVSKKQIYEKLTIPSYITYENKTYKVNAIGEDAFYNSYSSETISSVNC